MTITQRRLLINDSNCVYKYVKIRWFGEKGHSTQAPTDTRTNHDLVIIKLSIIVTVFMYLSIRFKHKTILSNYIVINTIPNAPTLHSTVVNKQSI